LFALSIIEFVDEGEIGQSILEIEETNAKGKLSK
jgi:hypothetical protein